MKDYLAWSKTWFKPLRPWIGKVMKFIGYNWILAREDFSRPSMSLTFFLSNSVKSRSLPNYQISLLPQLWEKGILVIRLGGTKWYRPSLESTKWSNPVSVGAYRTTCPASIRMTQRTFFASTEVCRTKGFASTYTCWIYSSNFGWRASNRPLQFRLEPSEPKVQVGLYLALTHFRVCFITYGKIKACQMWHHGQKRDPWHLRHKFQNKGQ